MEPTPRVTDHAKERCHEMGIRTKVAKSIVRHSDVIYPGPSKHGQNWIATCRAYPEYAVAFTIDEQGVRWICTVLYNGVEFERPGTVEPMAANEHVEVYKSVDGWRWRRKEANGEVVSENHQGLSNKDHAVDEARERNPGVEVRIRIDSH